MYKKRVEAKGHVPRARLIRAMYKGKCRCGRLIEPSHAIYRDDTLNLNLCYPCGKSMFEFARAQLQVVTPESEVQKIRDRISQLQALIAPLSDRVLEELSQLKANLRRLK